MPYALLIRHLVLVRPICLPHFVLHHLRQLIRHMVKNWSRFGSSSGWRLGSYSHDHFFFAAFNWRLWRHFSWSWKRNWGFQSGTVIRVSISCIFRPCVIPNVMLGTFERETCRRWWIDCFEWFGMIFYVALWVINFIAGIDIISGNAIV